MIPKRLIEAYLRFLLRNRLAVTVVIALMTVFFAYQCSRCQPVPSRRANVSVGRMLTRTPYGFGTSRGVDKLCG